MLNPMARHAADSSVFSAIADPTRRAILDALRQGERGASELQGRVGSDITQPAFSQHLAVLRRAGLVEMRREGRRRIYRVDAEPLSEVTDWALGWIEWSADQEGVQWDAALGRLAGYLDRKHGAKPRRRAEREGAA